MRKSQLESAFPRTHLHLVRHGACTPPAVMEGEHTQKRRVLLVDPDPDTRESLAEYLAESFEIQSAGSARDALSILEHESTDAVVSEAELPDCFVPAFFLELRKRVPGAALVAIYGYGEWSQQAESHWRPTVDLALRKPFDIDGLKEALERLLQRARRDEQSHADGSPPA